jgi:hypothetical protein
MYLCYTSRERRSGRPAQDVHSRPAGCAAGCRWWLYRGRRVRMQAQLQASHRVEKTRQVRAGGSTDRQGSSTTSTDTTPAAKKPCAAYKTLGCLSGDSTPVSWTVCGGVTMSDTPVLEAPSTTAACGGQEYNAAEQRRPWPVGPWYLRVAGGWRGVAWRSALYMCLVHAAGGRLCAPAVFDPAAEYAAPQACTRDRAVVGARGGGGDEGVGSTLYTFGEASCITSNGSRPDSAG